jgi:uncharacterized protein (TIGR03435 family)
MWPVQFPVDGNRVSRDSAPSTSPVLIKYGTRNVSFVVPHYALRYILWQNAAISEVRMKFLRPLFLLVFVMVLYISFAASSASLGSQSALNQTPTAQPAMPDWQTEAGGKLAFDVASVKQNKCGLPPECPLTTNVSLVPGDFYSPNGGVLRLTNWNFMPFIVFAYKLNANQYKSLTDQLPKWTKTERFDIEARAANSSPTKDQMRLMMQSLLADRFKLMVHTESRQLPVFALVLDKPGKLGPQLRSHSDDPPCAPSDSPEPLAKVGGGYPAMCGINLGGIASGRRNLTARDVPMELIGSWLGATGPLSRPVFDQTGLRGTFDFKIEWTPKFNGPPPPNFQPDPSGPTFLEALKDQLGLKLESQTGPVDVLVIDHIEEPSPN